MCLGMFSAVPCPYRPWDEEARSLMTACLPVVGAIIGGLWYLLSRLSVLLLPEMLSAALIAALPFLLTGFMHLDGFMDTSDAVLSWRPLEKRIEILKDVHCGSFAAVSLVLLAVFMLAAACDARESELRALMLIPVVSRCLSAFCVTALKPIGHSEYASMKRSGGTPAAALAILLIAFLTGCLWLGMAAFTPLLATAAGYACAMAFAYRTMDGVSGDLAGYSLCIGELCGLAALAIFH